MPRPVEVADHDLGIAKPQAQADLLARARTSPGAEPPRRFPVWLARLLAGEAVVVLSTEARGASNAKAKRELGWTPRHPSRRTGFAAAYTPAGRAGGRTRQPAGVKSHAPT